MRLALAAILALRLSGASPAIGTVVAKGAFLLDHSAVTGNATLLEGTFVEARAAATSIQLDSGARVALTPDSKAKFYGDRMILEKGEGQLERASGFRFEARGLTIQPETGNSAARVVLAGRKRVQVQALAGSFRVLNAQGIAVASLSSGKALEFEPGSPEGLTKLSGCLFAKTGHFLLTDETTSVVVELAGSGLEKEAGNRIEVTGSADPAVTPLSDASQFIHVLSLKRLGKACLAAVGIPAAAPGAGGLGRGGAGGGAGAGAGGISTLSTTVAVVGGVSAATVGGLAAAGKLPGQETVAPISR